MDDILSKLNIKRVDHLPIIKSFCNKLDLINVVNSLVTSEMEIKPGVVVQAMVMDTLSGRSPLYRLADFFEELDTELLLGKGIKADDFNDTNVGRTMDRIYEASTMKILSELALRATGFFNIDMKYIHYDTTSVSVWGDYPMCEELDNILKITHGHSKDHRPDLKQFLMEMLCVDKNIPIMGGCLNGNSSDKDNNNKILSQITRHLARHGIESGAFIYIADSAMVTKKNLNQLNDTLFITRLPATYNECSRVIEEAIKKDAWADIGVLAKTKAPKEKPHAEYKVFESNVKLYDKSYRAVVVYSSAHNQRRTKRINKEIEKAKSKLTKEIKKQCKLSYACLPDAQKIAQEIQNLKSSPYHQVHTTIKEYVKYKGGRIKPNAIREIKSKSWKVEYEILELKNEIQEKKNQAGCFVLLTNVPKQDHDLAHSARDILINYKNQHGVERNFSFLKDPLIVNDLFLKNPNRIEVLGMILLISLLIWNLIERALRCFIKNENTTITGWDKKQTNRPTAFMMSTKFKGILIAEKDNKRYFVKSLKAVQNEYLNALGLAQDIFLNHGS
jgi:transposase